MNGHRLALVCAVLVASFGRRSEAFCGLRTGDGAGDFVTCLKAKAIATLDRVSRADTVPLTGSIALVREDSVDPQAHRRQRSDDDNGDPTSDYRLPASDSTITEHELRSKPDAALDRMLYDKAVRFFSGRAVRIGLPEFTPDQLRTALDEGRGKMKKTMGMMMTAAAMKAMMIIPLALGLLFLMAGKAMIISKIALVLSLIITLKKLISKSGEHVIHESHSSSAAWPSGGSSVGYGGGGGGGGGGVSGGWDKRSSAVAAASAGQVLAYNSYKP